MFFQTADVAARRAAILARGGNPSEIERVNWINMQMFEVRDPDGHVLWFGESYHEDDDSRRTQPSGMRQALPELPFDNVPAAITYYRDVLGFQINYRQDDLGVMDRDAITILLIARTERHKGIGSFEVYIDDADALYAELSAKDAKNWGRPSATRGVFATSKCWTLRAIESLSLRLLSDVDWRDENGDALK